jgi:arylsulfatase A-like enzyme
MPENYALSTERWRYIHYRDGGEELYDIDDDPHEWTNLATKPEHTAKLAEMRTLAPNNPIGHIVAPDKPARVRIE